MVLTGYNTDIDHAGTTYHVQTEDKGRSNPVVESLVYARGEILYSRRTSYQDLVDENVENTAIATVMERQHHTIVEAIRRGRLAQLTDEPGPVNEDDDTNISTRRRPPSSIEVEVTGERGEDEPTLDQVILDYLAAQRGRAHLVLRAVGNTTSSMAERPRFPSPRWTRSPRRRPARGPDHRALQIDLGAAPPGSRRG